MASLLPSTTLEERSGPEKSRSSRLPVLLDPETVSPFLHDRGDCLYNPLSGESLPKTGDGYRVLTRVAEGLPPEASEAVLDHLRAARFLIEDVEAEARRTRLLYVSLETCTSNLFLRVLPWKAATFT